MQLTASYIDDLPTSSLCLLFSLSLISSLLFYFIFSSEEILGTEETVWCPSLGIKGQMDMVARARERPVSGKEES